MQTRRFPLFMTPVVDCQNGKLIHCLFDLYKNCDGMDVPLTVVRQVNRKKCDAVEYIAIYF